MWNFYIELHNVEGEILYEDGETHWTHPAYTDDEIVHDINTRYDISMRIQGIHYGYLYIGNDEECRAYKLVLSHRNDGSIVLHLGGWIHKA